MAISIEANNESFPDLHINCLICVHDYQQIRILPKYFHIWLHDTISRKSVQWETRSCACVQTDAREANWPLFVPRRRAWKTSNFKSQDFDSVWIFGVLKQRYNLSPDRMSFYRRLRLLMACHLSIVAPLSISHGGSSASGTHFWAAYEECWCMCACGGYVFGRQV